jgi:hypothetical protein
MGKERKKRYACKHRKYLGAPKDLYKSAANLGMSKDAGD